MQAADPGQEESKFYDEDEANASELPREPVRVDVTPREKTWRDFAWERCGFKCVACGGSDHVFLRYVIPPEAGGKDVPENAVVVCRACNLADDLARDEKGAKRLASVWVSKPLHAWLLGNEETHGFSSASAFVRALIDGYLRDPEGHGADVAAVDPDDKPDSARARAALWLDHDKYAFFMVDVNRRYGKTVTDAITGLLVSNRASSPRKES